MGITIPQIPTMPKIAPLSGRYYGHHSLLPAGNAGVAYAANVLYAVPYWSNVPYSADRIALNISTTGTATLMRIGLYSSLAGTGQPGALLVDSGALDPSTTGIKEATIAQAIAAARLYWLALLTNGTLTATAVQPNIALLGQSSASDATGAVGLQVAQAYGALPASWGTWSAVFNSMPHILLRAV